MFVSDFFTGCKERPKNDAGGASRISSTIDICRKKNTMILLYIMREKV